MKILKKMKCKKINMGNEQLEIYPLGIFENKMFELVALFPKFNYVKIADAENHTLRCVDECNLEHPKVPNKPHLERCGKTQGLFDKPHIHKNSEAKLHMIFGEGEIIINKKSINYKEGDVFIIKKGVGHGFKVKKETLMLSIQKPPIINYKTGEIYFAYS